MPVLLSPLTPVTRSKAAARATYDRLSGWYDLLAGSERRFARLALRKLDAQPGESVLEIGPGTGHGLVALAQATGPFGRVIGLDLSPRMLEKAGQKVTRAGVTEPVRLVCADGVRLPVRSSCFDAVFLSFTLELFDTPEIGLVLEECRRVLRPAGRIGVVAMRKEGGAPWMLRLYEWAHRRFPDWVDCRPIHPTQAIAASGFQILETVGGSMWGLPVEIVIGVRRTIP